MPANTAVRRSLATKNTAHVYQLKRLLALENPATKQGECVPEEDVPCGNGILDENEECDVGESVVKNQDKCCNSTCHLRVSGQCSGVSEPCCKDCNIAQEGTVCGDPNEDPCWERAKCEGRCVYGRCITKDCQELGDKNNRLYRACMCDNDINACKSCCQEDLGNKIYGPCFPTETRLGLRERCYNGVCNEQGKCVSEKDVPCGNGVLDTEEECDAGEESLKNQDKCCNSTCHLRESAQCSGFNKPCCKDCKIAPQGTDCEYNFDLPCMESAKCEGQCINGRCITTYCKELGEKDNRRYRACMCDHDVSRIVFLGQLMQHSFCLLPASAACKRCCLEKGVCIPSEGFFTVRLFKFFNNLDFDTLGTGQIFFENNFKKQIFVYLFKAETMKTNLVMTVVFLTALFWIPISCCISCMIKKRYTDFSPTDVSPPDVSEPDVLSTGRFAAGRFGYSYETKTHSSDVPSPDDVIFGTFLSSRRWCMYISQTPEIMKFKLCVESVVLHKVIAMENRKLQIEENNLHKQLFHYETLKKSDISLHVRHHRDVDTGHVTARTYVTFFTLGMGVGRRGDTSLHQVANDRLQTSQFQAMSSIRDILVHTEYSNGPSRGPFSYNYEVDQWNIGEKLRAFSHHRDIMQYCLAHLFTHTLFKDRTDIFGLAFVGNTQRNGGICSRRSEDMYRRTGWTTSKYGKGWILVGAMHQITTAHGTANCR
ncbi:hypothetical protein C0Q70_00627 [Pomacea canaliculata]|uniref:Disintegrin domain-containing protein n=1 Tax=Pomacea canaliculata TaxID=400727 RepID=A0A2T7PX74_POMCA|nr:hypothetical protein C0Q70_00627 [Pomacea canaliculata]